MVLHSSYVSVSMLHSNASISMLHNNSFHFGKTPTPLRPEKIIYQVPGVCNMSLDVPVYVHAVSCLDDKIMARRISVTC